MRDQYKKITTFCEGVKHTRNLKHSISLNLLQNVARVI